MNATEGIPCSRCAAEVKPHTFFCTECGEPTSAVAASGNAAVEVQEVASERLKARLVSALGAWFPGLDRFEAEKRLRSDWTVLLNGIDVAYADRLVASLKKMNIGARVTDGKGSIRDFLNSGLIVTGAALVLLPFVNMVTSLLLVIAAVGAPLGVAVLKSKQRAPLVEAPRHSFPHDAWLTLATQYAQAVQSLSEEDAALLKEIARSVFETERKLSESSVSAAAAGEEEGALATTMRTSLNAAVETGLAMLHADLEQRQALRSRLVELRDAVIKTEHWFRGLEGRAGKPPDEIVDELASIRSRIDSVLGEVEFRESPKEALASRENLRK